MNKSLEKKKIEGRALKVWPKGKGKWEINITS